MDTKSSVQPGDTSLTFTNGSSNSGFLYIASFEAAAGVGSAYVTWAATNAPTTGSDPSADEDGDGVSNAIESVVGGSISTNDLGKLPTVHQDGANMTFSFQRAQQSIDPSTVLTIEACTDLATWPDVYPVPDGATAGPPVTVVKDSSPGFDTVTLSLPMAAGGGKFVRLKINLAP